jgi:hypothetical protein
MSNFMTVRPVGAELFHADGRADGRTDGRMEPDMKLIVSFRNYANASENCNSAVWNVSFCAVKEKARVGTLYSSSQQNESSKVPIIWPSVRPHYTAHLSKMSPVKSRLSDLQVAHTPFCPKCHLIKSLFHTHTHHHHHSLYVQQLYILLINKAACDGINYSVLL